MVRPHQKRPHKIPKTEYLKRYIVIILLILVTLISHLMWRIKPASVMNTVIIDKTVPWDTYREHFGLTWVMQYLKYTKPDYTYYDPTIDYIGYYPDERNNPRLLTKQAVANKDLVYFADTYGVYTLDLISEDKSAGLDWSKEIFGGVEASELEAIQEYIGNNGFLIGEYNFFASPTEMGVRNSIEDILKVKWSGWTGRYFRELSNTEEIPKWLPRLYERQYGKFYDLEGSGIAFVHEDLRIVILEDEEDDFKEYVYLSSLPEAGDIINEKEVTVPFFYWFDIVETQESGTTLAEYSMRLEESGKKKLQEFGIPETFPGVIKHKSNYVSYYFAGDFADSPVQGELSTMFQWIPSLMNMITFFDNSHSQHRFFWNVYFPMMKNILEEAHNHKGYKVEHITNPSE